MVRVEMNMHRGASTRPLELHEGSTSVELVGRYVHDVVASEFMGLFTVLESACVCLYHPPTNCFSCHLGVRSVSVSVLIF